MPDTDFLSGFGKRHALFQQKLAAAQQRLSKAEPKSVSKEDGADGIPPEDAAGSGAPEEPEGETLKLPDVLQLREQLTARAVQQGHLPSKMATSGDLAKLAPSSLPKEGTKGAERRPAGEEPEEVGAAKLAQMAAQRAQQREEHRARLADLSKQAEQMKAVLHGQAPGAEGGEAASELVDPGLAKQVSRLRQLKDQQSQVAADLQQMRPGAKGEHVKGDKGDLKGHGKGGFKGDPGTAQRRSMMGKGPPDFKGKGYGGGKGKAFGKWPGKGDFFGGQIPEMLPEEAQAQAATAAEAFQQQQQWYPDWYASPPPMQAYRSPPMNRRSMQRPMQPPGMPRGDYRRSRGHALYGTSNPTLELARGAPLNLLSTRGPAQSSPTPPGQLRGVPQQARKLLLKPRPVLAVRGQKMAPCLPIAPSCRKTAPTPPRPWPTKALRSPGARARRRCVVRAPAPPQLTPTSRPPTRSLTARRAPRRRRRWRRAVWRRRMCAVMGILCTPLATKRRK